MHYGKSLDSLRLWLYNKSLTWSSPVMAFSYKVYRQRKVVSVLLKKERVSATDGDWKMVPLKRDLIDEGSESDCKLTRERSVKRFEQCKQVQRVGCWSLLSKIFLIPEETGSTGCHKHGTCFLLPAELPRLAKVRPLL